MTGVQEDEDYDQKRVMLMVHDLKPPFLDGNTYTQLKLTRFKLSRTLSLTWHFWQRKVQLSWRNTGRGMKDRIPNRNRIWRVKNWRTYLQKRRSREKKVMTWRWIRMVKPIIKMELNFQFFSVAKDQQPLIFPKTKLWNNRDRCSISMKLETSWEN